MPETIAPGDWRRLHERTEQLLGVILAAQGREPTSYSLAEYALAFDAARKESPRSPQPDHPELKPRTTEMTNYNELYDPSAVLHALAEGTLDEGYTASDYMRAIEQVSERHPEIRAAAATRRSETVRGQETHDAAMALLASRGVHSPDYNQLADAYIEVADKEDE